MITYLIIDDEYIAHDIIQGYCNLLPNLKLMKNCYDAFEAMEYLQNNRVDLLFLDLNMPKLKGFDFLRTLPIPPKVIVTTAYKEHALEGYELNISDYLLKPFSFERFLKAINKTFSTHNEQSPSYKTSNVSKRVFFKSNKKYVQIELSKILFIEAAGNYIKLIAADTTITLREKLSTVLEELPKEDFLQVHKSFVVATAHIHSIEGNRIHVLDYTIPIGKLYKSNITRIIE
ncbi:LytTR family DNA-binding domain-containing protein [Tenacibaculum sp. SG-28]|uniref:LytR/AlgR family response regulator transcription factor n=1 Tax=Tenacibaculum sp. SG-28 TaxID=754426 RepID=UPI000CF391F6|nr:LytTR family DNA-binding domain-containing protein [Tenacibaculum sp. SG-28]PQJ20816.1 DNA-binding response regulator [Tenacibaculum sp. SG-28]